MLGSGTSCLSLCRVSRQGAPRLGFCGARQWSACCARRLSWTWLEGGAALAFGTWGCCLTPQRDVMAVWGVRGAWFQARGEQEAWILESLGRRRGPLVHQRARFAAGRSGGPAWAWLWCAWPRAHRAWCVFSVKVSRAVVSVALMRRGASVRDVGLLGDASAGCHGRFGRPTPEVASGWRACAVEPGVFGVKPRRRAGRVWPDGLVGHKDRRFAACRSGGSSWAQLRCGATACGASSVFWVLLSRDVAGVWGVLRVGLLGDASAGCLGRFGRPTCGVASGWQDRLRGGQYRRFAACRSGGLS